ncbi:SH3 domain-containing protein [Streptomyces sp. NRRL F-2664]|uniref:SH3 domain-containing protein n=1 Tax=Streptomyces sp. NRRL F-2664 TaxID=1463842 RepID=UPI0004C9ADCA|nr:SH3 domain-containing protein [Streptomyces sp. NRRL F-2664]
MLKPTRTILALATGSLVLGLLGVGAAVADEGPREIIVGEGPASAQPGGYPYDRYAFGKVVSRGPLKVRSKPTTTSRAVGQVQPNSRVEIECKKYGENVSGNRVWYRLHDDRENGDNGSDREDMDREDMDREDMDREDMDREDMDREDMDREDMDREDTGREDRRAKAYEQERWVSARYVRNLSEVKYCR